jgi:hypothetical protein
MRGEEQERLAYTKDKLVKLPNSHGVPQIYTLCSL